MVGRTERELIARIEALERQSRQIDVSPELRLQSGAWGHSVSQEKYPRKLVQVTEVIRELIFDRYTGGAGTNPIGYFYNHSWRVVEHDRVSGILRDTAAANDSVSGSGELIAVEMGYRNLRTLNNTQIPVGTRVEIYRQDDREGSWWYADIDPASANAFVCIVGYVTDQEISGSNCSGSGSCDPCKPIYHYGILQTFDPLCEQWVDGSCVWVIEKIGRRLETGMRYRADRIGTAPAFLQAVILPPGSPSCGDNPPLYCHDMGYPTRTILVGDRIGKLCPSGSGGDSFSLEPDNLTWYYGTAQRWDDVACGWVVIEDVIVAAGNGCGLNSGNRVAAHFNKMMLDSHVGGSGALDCVPSYIHVPEKKAGVYTAECCSGGGVRFYTYTGNCNEVSLLECGCTGGSTSGSGSICGHWDAVPAQYQFTLTGITGTCLNCLNYDATWVLDHTAPGSNTWQKDVSGSNLGCPGLNPTTFSLTCVDPYMILDIGGAQYRRLLSAWNVFGSNSMDLFGTTNPACTGWPDPVVVTAV